MRNIAGLQTAAFNKGGGCLALLHWLRSVALLGWFTPNNQACSIRIVEQPYPVNARFLLTKSIDGYLYAMTLGRFEDDDKGPQYVLVTIEGPNVYFRERQKNMDAVSWWGTPPSELQAKIKKFHEDKASELQAMQANPEIKVAEAEADK
jgi:hypothetical protein